MIYPGFLLVGVFVALSLFYYVSQKARIRKEERRDARREREQEHLVNLLNKNKKDHPSQ